MAIKFSQFNLRTDHTSGMYLVGYDGNQNIHITVDNLFDDFINGTENTIAMFGTGGTVLADSILSQNAGATALTVAGQLNVDAAATFDTNITVEGNSTLKGNVGLGDADTDLIIQTGTLHLNGPVKDVTDTLGTTDQVLLSNASGKLTFTYLSDLHVGGAEVVEVPVKNVQGSALVKGDPVYISGSVGASGRLEVQLADASNTLKMPAVGLLKQDLANNAEGFAVVTGKLRNLITDPIDGVNPTENDVIYVKPSGTSGAALTTTKPVYGNFIQNIGKVGRVSTSNDGNFVVSSILRTNDIPNLTPGRLWVGSTGNTIESQTIFVDEANAQVGIGTTSPAASVKLHVEGALRVNGGNLNVTNTSLPIIYLNTSSSSTDNYSIRNSSGNFQVKNQAGLGQIQFQILNSGQAKLDLYGQGTFTGAAAKNLSIDSSGNVIETSPPIDGTGAAGQVAYWSDTDTITGENDFSWDAANNRLGIGVGLSPTANIDIKRNASDTATSLAHTDTKAVAKFIGSTSGNGQLTISQGAGATQNIQSSNQAGSAGGYLALNPFGGSVSVGAAIGFHPLYVAKGASVGGSSIAVFENLSTAPGEIKIQNSEGSHSIRTDGGAFDIYDHGNNRITATISSFGQLSLHQYGSGTFTGTAARNLSVTSSGAVIETNPSVDGSGTLNYVTKWTPDGNSLGNSTIFDNGSQVGIGTSSPQNYYSGADNLVVSQSSGEGGITIATANNTNGALYFADGTSGSEQYRGGIGYNHSNDELFIVSGGGTKATMDSIGRLGIGTSSPGQRLDVNGNIQLAQYGYIYFGSNSGNQLRLSNSLSGSQITQSGSGPLELQSASNDIHLKAGGLTKAVVRATGNVGIGTTSPDYTLDVAGNAGFDEYLYHNGDSDTNIRFLNNNIYLNAGGGGGLQCSNSTTALQAFHEFYSNSDFKIGDHIGINSGMSLQLGGLGSDLTFESSAGYKAIFSNSSTTYFQTNVGIGTTNTTGTPLRVVNSNAGTNGPIFESTNMMFTGTALEVHSTSNSNVQLMKLRSVNTDRFIVGGAGQIGVGGANYGTSGQVLTSNGSGSAPSWQNASGSSNWTTSGNNIYNNNSGNVGIGTSNPSQKLDVSGSIRLGQYSVLEWGNNNSAKLTIQKGLSGATFTHFGSGNIELNPTSGGITFKASSSTAATLTSSGNFGIGTTSPATKLDVNGGIRMANSTLTAASSNVGTLRYRTSGNNSYVDMSMQTGPSTYEWVNIVQNNW